MAVKFSNNAATELASSIGASDTSISVVDGSLFPALGAGDYTYVTLDADTNPPLREIVRVTAVSGNTLTVVRAQDGTTAAAFDAGAKVELRLTAALLNDVATEASATDWATVQNKPDPTVYLSGDVTGQGTMTDLGDVTISVTVVDDSHNHTVANVDGLQTALDGKAPLTGTGTSGTWPIAISGNAATATALATARTISLTGDVTGSVSFDGSGNVSLTATITDDSHNHVISNVDGLQAALDAKYDASNPSGYVTTAGARSAISASGSLSYNSSTGVMSFTDAITSVAGKTGAVTLTSSDVGLGNVENKSSATIRGEITSGNVTTALGFTPYDSTNPSGYITSSALSSYLPLSGGTLTGTFTVNTNANQVAYFQSPNPNTWVDIISTAGTWSMGATASNRWAIYNRTGTNGTRFEVDTSSAYVNGNTVLHAGNYTSYSPSLTGSGASGTWGISITGNAATATSADQIDGWAFRNTGSNSGTAADSIESNGITYVSGNISLLGQTDGALYSQAYSGAWQHQIFGDYRTGQIAIRGKNNGTWQSWRTVLDSGNYGSGYFKTINGSSIIGTGDLTVSGTDSTKLPLSGGDMTGRIRMGTFAQSQTNTGEAWIGRAADRNTGTLTVQLGGNSASGRTFEVVDYPWSTVLFHVASENYVQASGSFRAPIFYDSGNTGYSLNGDVSSAWRLSTPSGYLDIGPMNSSYCHFQTDRSNFYFAQQVQFDNNAIDYSGNWALYDGYGIHNGSWRAPIFYDSNDTGYYVNPNSASQFSLVYADNWFRAQGATGLYSNTYGTHWYSEDAAYWTTSMNGSNGGIRFRSGYNGTIRGYVYADTNDSIGFLNGGGSWRARVVGGDYFLVDGSSARAPLYYDSNNTSYYLDPAGTSRVATLDTDRVTYLSKGYDSVYLGGSGLYQIGYPDTNWWKISSSSTMSLLLSCGWDWDRQVGFHYTPAASGSNGGTLRIGQTSKNSSSYNHTYTYMHMNGADRFYWDWNGVFQAYGDCRAPIFYEQGNTAYYLDLSSTSYLYHLVLSGASYFRPSSWIQLDGTYGLYWPNNYGAHLYPNNFSSYTQFRLNGQYNGYGGIVDSYSAVAGIMYDSAGNGGVYREASGRWYLYHHVGNNCMGVGTSTTSSSYYMYVGGGIYSTGNVVAYSDARSKTNVVTVDSALDKVSKLRGVYYTRLPGRDPEIDTNRREIGVIAQEVNEVLPEVVTYAKDVDEYGVQYGNFAGLFIEAFKELKAEVEALRAEVSTLRGRLGE